MGNYDVPDSVIQIDAGDADVGIGTTTHTWFHLDDLDTHIDDDVTTLHPYIFKHEGRKDELFEAVSNLRSDHIFAHGVVWPDTLDGVIQFCDDDVIADIEWFYSLSPYMNDDKDSEWLAMAAMQIQLEVEGKLPDVHSK